MSLLVLYLLLLKATLVSFAGLGSLPVVHNDFVVQRKLITDRQLNTAVAAARMGPGPFGLYLVCVGYLVGGASGAAVGYLAMMTPAFLIIPILRYLGSRAENPAVKRTIRAVILAAAGLLISATIPLARDALTGVPAVLIAGASFLILMMTRLDTMWVILGSALLGFGGHWVGLV